MQKPWILVAAAFLLAGCSLTPGLMSADRIEAMGKLKDAGTVCLTATSPWGKGTLSYTLVDRTIAATVTVKDDCSVTVETKGPPPRP